MSVETALFWQGMPPDILEHILSFTESSQECVDLCFLRGLRKHYAAKHKMHVYLHAPGIPLEKMVTFMIAHMMNNRNEEGDVMKLPAQVHCAFYSAVYTRCARPSASESAKNSCVVYNLIANSAFLNDVLNGGSALNQERVKKTMTLAFKYLDRFYVKRNSLPEIREVLFPLEM
jgi:hypothetical protein